MDQNDELHRYHIEIAFLMALGIVIALLVFFAWLERTHKHGKDTDRKKIGKPVRSSGKRLSNRHKKRKG